LSHGEAIAAIQDAHLASFLPKVKVREMAALAAGDSAVVIVDARPANAFASGHIPRAINIPYDTESKECMRLLGPTPRESRIVVYCHSNGCGFSETLARRLLSCGFSRVELFRGGWVEWQGFSFGDARSS
jgi:rhodanese-related sulfurtransferase